MAVGLQPVTVAAVQVEGLAELRRDLRVLGDRAPRVMARTLNKTTTNTRAFAARTIREKATLKSARIKRDISIKRANGGDLSAQLILRGGPVGLEHYGGRLVRAGVSFKVRRDQPRKVIHAGFQGQGKLPASTLWKRVRNPSWAGRCGGVSAQIGGRKPISGNPYHFQHCYGADGYAWRLPIKRLVGPSVPNLLGEDPQLMTLTLDHARQRLRINGRNELDYALSRMTHG